MFALGLLRSLFGVRTMLKTWLTLCLVGLTSGRMVVGNRFLTLDIEVAGAVAFAHLPSYISIPIHGDLRRTLMIDLRVAAGSTGLLWHSHGY